MLVTRQIPALFNGVSQQPSPVRAPSQWQFQSNITSSVVDGVRRRSPVEHIKQLTTSDFSTAYLHGINRDINERYLVFVTEAGIKVFDMEGNEKTVTAPLGWGYLDLPTDAEGRFCYKAVTVADYTFIVNKTKTVELGDVGDDLDPPDDDYWWLNRVISDSPSAMTALSENGGFRYNVDGYSGGGGAWRGGGSTTPPVNTNTGITANAAGTLHGTVQTLQDLDGVTPTVGDVYKIVGTNESNFQSYYVRWSGSAWNEAVLPGLRNLIDATTMPHALVRQGDGTFLFGPFAWSPRRVGDEATNPNPSFVGRQIRDVYFYKNRLGFCTDENVVLSRAGDFGNYYRLTVVDYLPDEVVDIAASENQVAKMEFAVPFQSVMMLFSDQTQFKLTHDTVFTGATVSLVPTTKYPMVPSVPPAQSGSDVYFASQGSGWGQLREYFVDDDNDTHSAADVSAHIPRYIPNDINNLVASPDFDFVGIITDAEPARIYAYQYYWENETEKAQSAWNYWDISTSPVGTAKILGAAVLGGYLYMAVQRSRATDTAVFLERMALFYGSGIADLDFQVYLDRRVAITGVYNATSDVTTFTVPYSLLQEHKVLAYAVRGDAFGDEKGSKISVSQMNWLDATHFTVLGNESAGPVAFGIPFESRLVFSRQFAVNSKGEAINSGRLQLKTFSVYYADSAYLKAQVRPFGADTLPLYEVEFPTRKLNVEQMDNLGAPVFAEGKCTFAVQANAAEAEIAITSDSYLGFCLSSAEWEGFYFNRARA